MKDDVENCARQSKTAKSARCFVVLSRLKDLVQSRTTTTPSTWGSVPPSSA
jgi:hypothetical protein